MILGPTASGKSALAVKMAKKINGEIISADSRQVYKGLDIGSGKITKKEMGGVPHYCLNIISPKKIFTVVDFKKCADKAIEKIINWLEEKGVGKKTISYKLRDWLFSRQRYWGEPIPILHFEDGTKRALDLDELPLLAPQIDDYKPAGDGKSPLSKVKDWS